MNLQINGDRYDVTLPDKALIEEKINVPLDRMLQNFSDDLKIASLRIQKDKNDNFLINFDMNLPGKEHVYAQTSHRLFESALIDLEQEIEKQLQRYKEEINH